MAETMHAEPLRQIDTQPQQIVIQESKLPTHRPDLKFINRIPTYSTERTIHFSLDCGFLLVVVTYMKNIGPNSFRLRGFLHSKSKIIIIANILSRIAYSYFTLF